MRCSMRACTWGDAMPSAKAASTAWVTAGCSSVSSCRSASAAAFLQARQGLSSVPVSQTASQVVHYADLS